MSTVEVGVSIEERMVTVDRVRPSKSAKYKLLLTFGLAYITSDVYRPPYVSTNGLCCLMAHGPHNILVMRMWNSR